MWWHSIRSITALAVALTFCYLGVIGKLDAKDFMVVAIVVFNFYFFKQRSNGETLSPTLTEKKEAK